MATGEFLDTRQAARLLGFSGPDSLRTALYRNGGTVRDVKPAELPNGRLGWPADAVIAARPRGRSAS
jgi:hypothetical protein